MSTIYRPDPASLRAQLTELNIRSRTYTTQIWQVPFAYLGILGVVVAQAAGKAPGLLVIVLGSAVLVGAAVIFHVSAMLDGSRRAVEDIRKIEAALGLDETAQHKPFQYVGPIFAILLLAVVLCVFGTGYVAWSITAGGVTMSLSEIKDIATILGVLVGAGALASAALTLMITVRTNRAKFWLELRSAFVRHDEVHRKLRPGGEWSASAGPKDTEEFAQIEAYMGLFEHCEIMLSQKLIDQVTFAEIYRYRLQNLVANDWVRIEKLCRRPDGWTRFIALLKRVNVEYKCSTQADG